LSSNNLFIVLRPQDRSSEAHAEIRVTCGATVIGQPIFGFGSSTQNQGLWSVVPSIVSSLNEPPVHLLPERVLRELRARCWVGCFVPDILWAKPADDQKATQPFYRAPAQASFNELPGVTTSN
jgi:hypothetical protein